MGCARHCVAMNDGVRGLQVRLADILVDPQAEQAQILGVVRLGPCFHSSESQDLTLDRRHGSTNGR